MENPNGKALRDARKAMDENDKQYAKVHVDERKHIIFHGGCVKCVTPLYYGLGNCLGCLYYQGVTSKYPDLGIRNYREVKCESTEVQNERDKFEAFIKLIQK